MHRLMHFFRRRQHAPAAEPTLTVQGEVNYWYAEAQRLRAPLDGTLKQSIQEAMTRIGNVVWPNWKMPQTPPLPANVLPLIRETAREARADIASIFSADNLPLMDDPFYADVDWKLDLFNAVMPQLTPATRATLHRLSRAPARASWTLTIFAPPVWCEDEDAICAVEMELYPALAGILGLDYWGIGPKPTWRASDTPGWAVSIAEVEKRQPIPLWLYRDGGNDAA
jgi:hypothetical protein